MSDIVIRTENLGKSYIIGHENRERYTALRDVLPQKIKQIADKTRQIFRGGQLIAGNELEEFWALKEINFELKRGDRLGIIGRNGAGKSTLLKVLSRITEPTTGRVQIKGRLASLLEVGTGFHPELSGRENIFLNGAILGMSRLEIKKKFDEIVDFSGVEKFLDTPVKRYSSGMYVRLAFSVAANLESEILIVDEVLAVGDAAFQKKCLGKMKEVSTGEGRTVIFVSHNMGAVEQLCGSGILLVNGKLELYSNNITDVIKRYLRPESTIVASYWENSEKKYFSEYFSLHKFYLSDEDGNILPSIVDNSNDFYVNFYFEIANLDLALEISYVVYDDEYREIYCSQQTDIPEKQWPKIKKGSNIFRTKIPKRFLNEGLYHIKPGASLYKRMSLLEPTKHNISVDLNIVGGLSESPYWYSRRSGILAPVFEWEVVK